MLISLTEASISVTSQEEAKDAIALAFDQIGCSSLIETIGECTVSKPGERTYYRFAQQYNGIPVYGCSATLDVDSKGLCSALSNDFAFIGSAIIEPVITSDEALDSISSEYGEILDFEDYGLVLFMHNRNNPMLCYQYYVANDDTTETVLVSAASGDIVNRQQLTHTELVEGTGKTKKNESVTFNTDRVSDAKYDLTDLKRGISVYNAKGKTLKSYRVYRYADGKLYRHEGDMKSKKAHKFISLEDGEEVWIGDEEKLEYAGLYLSTVGIIGRLELVSNKSTQWSDKTAVTAIHTVATAYDYYDKVLAYSSFSGDANSFISVCINDFKSFDYGNAYSKFGFTGEDALLSFGLDNDIDIDVVGHEFAHAVEGAISGMEYKGESGAIMEAASDIFGELIQDYADDGEMNNSCDWIHGSRSLATPEKMPTVYEGEYWKSIEKDDEGHDYGYVHTNLTVLAHAAYQMCNEGSLDGETLTTKELGQVLLDAFYMLPSDCNFAMFAGVVERKAADLLSSGKAERVQAAFEAAGIDPILIVYLDGSRNESKQEFSIDEALESQIMSLDAKDYAVEYQYRARGYDNNPNFEWIVSDELPDEAVVGTQIADYDGDREDELLAVVWRNDTIDFDMYEVDGRTVRLAATMSDVATLAFPIKGNGTLDVAMNDNGSMFMQWWQHAAPVADYHDWTIMCIDYDGERFVASGSATVAGTGMLSLEELRSDMGKLGLRTDYVPSEDSGDFTTSSVTDLDSTLKLIARATAWVDDDAVATTAYREMQDGSSTWGDLKHLGDFCIGPNTPAWNDNSNSSSATIDDKGNFASVSSNDASNTESIAGAGEVQSGNVARKLPAHVFMDG